MISLSWTTIIKKSIERNCFPSRVDEWTTMGFAIYRFIRHKQRFKIF